MDAALLTRIAHAPDYDRTFRLPCLYLCSYSASLVAVRGAPRDNFFAAVGNSQRWVSADLFLRKAARGLLQAKLKYPCTPDFGA